MTRIGPGLRSIGRASGCGSCGLRVRGVADPARRSGVDQHAAVFDLDGIGRHCIRFKTGFALAVTVMKFPEMPWTCHIVAIQPAFAERAADVIADAGNCAEAAVAAGQRDTRALEHDLLQFAFGQFRGIADVDPFLFCHAVPPGFMKFVIRITLAIDFSSA